MAEFETGQRVEVIAAPDVPQHIKQRGYVYGNNPADEIPVVVLLDNGQIDAFFYPELRKVEVRVVEGRVDEQGFILEGSLEGPSTAFMRVGKEYRGKWLRVTVEELEWPADSPTPQPVHEEG